MFERTQEAQALDVGDRHVLAYSMALLAHVAGVAAIAAMWLFAVRQVEGPDVPDILVLVGPAPPMEQARPGPDSRTPKQRTDDAFRPVVPPRETPREVAPPIDGPEPPPELVPIDDRNGMGLGTPGDGTEPGNGSGDGDGPGSADALGDGSGDGSGDGPPLALSGDMVTPVLVRKVEPLYPVAARLARLQGRVVLQAVVGVDGRVEALEILHASNPLFTAAAADAVREWRYRPATMNGRPVRVYFTVSVEFVMR